MAAVQLAAVVVLVSKIFKLFSINQFSATLLPLLAIIMSPSGWINCP
jgi:hypothetical protein